MASDYTDMAKEKSAELTGIAKEKAQDLSQQAGDLAGNVKQKVSESAEEAGSESDLIFLLPYLCNLKPCPSNHLLEQPIHPEVLYQIWVLTIMRRLLRTKVGGIGKTTAKATVAGKVGGTAMKFFKNKKHTETTGGK